MEEKTAVSKKKIADIILIVSLVVLSLVLILVFWLGGKTGEYVVVTVNGEEVGTYSLAIDGEYQLNGGTNTLVIKSGKAYIGHANCPDKLCINQGKVSRTGERIVCLPNKITVTVIGDAEDDFIPMN